jgi:hypothetical protein
MAIKNEQSDLKTVWLRARDAWARCVEGKEAGDPDLKFREMMEADRAYRRASDRRGDASKRKKRSHLPPDSPFEA